MDLSESRSEDRSVQPPEYEATFHMYHLVNPFKAIRKGFGCTKDEFADGEIKEPVSTQTDDSRDNPPIDND